MATIAVPFFFLAMNRADYFLKISVKNCRKKRRFPQGVEYIGIFGDIKF